MYKKTIGIQQCIDGFNQPVGLRMNPENRWVQMAKLVPWDKLEDKYAKLFKSKTGNVAKPVRMALGALIIQTKYGYSDVELVEQITENPYYQYFIGLPGYRQERPFDASTLVLFRRRITSEMLMEVNEYMLGKDDDDNVPPESNEKPETETANEGTLMLDATCAPVNIRYPQDVSLLNESREKLEKLIEKICKSNGIKMPRRYARQARNDYLSFAKSKKLKAKNIRNAIRKQLGYVSRDISHIEKLLNEGYQLTIRDAETYEIIKKLYAQQKYMYDNKTHSVEDRIVSLEQPWIRPIVRGKVSVPVEFGIKFDMSLDSDGYGRIERVSFNAYNEGTTLKDAVEHYKERTGYYPNRLLADKVYRTRENRTYCKERGIRLSGPKLGRPSPEDKVNKKTEYQDNVDRIEIERAFSLSKRCFGMDKIRTKLQDTQLCSLALSVFTTNLFKLHKKFLYALLSFVKRLRIKFQFVVGELKMAG